MIKTRVLVPDQNFIELHECVDSRMSAASWVAAHRPEVERSLLSHGVVLLRGFATDEHDFRRVADEISPVWIDYRGGNAQRTALPGNIFTSTELPPSITLVQHHEMMFTLCWPMKLLFYCDLPAGSGGETPLCSGPWVTRKLPAHILREFEVHDGITYIRNFRSDSPVKSMEDTFNTRDREEIERLCRQDRMVFEWKEWEGATWLQTRQKRPAFRAHPVTGDRVFVATAHLWHRAAWTRQLTKSTAQYSIEALAGDPTTSWMHALYGDGTVIDDTVVSDLYEFFEREKICIPWQRGDILILDNILASHGRNSFKGDRRILAALRQPYHAESGFLAKSA
jgi:alpha-ketoglutarate-dependent taurine dioxygenase